MFSLIRVFLSRIFYHFNYVRGYVFYRFKHNPVIFCFFPFSSVGGAEKVHLDILKSISDAKPYIFIRYKINPWLSLNEKEDTAWLNLFNKFGNVVFLSDYLESSKLSYLNTAWIQGWIVGSLNANNKSVLFFWNDSFIKALFPFLKQHVRVIDIIHNLKPDNPSDLEYLNLDVVPRINKRILVSPHLKDMLELIYKNNNIDPLLINRAHVILNGTNIPDEYSEKPDDKILKLIFVARDAPEKRIYLINRIAEKLSLEKIPFVFNIIGPDPQKWKDNNIININWLGLITDEKTISEMYKNSHIFILVSYTEGMPKTLIEAMSFGCVPVITDVGDISEYISDRVNGYLLPVNPEELMVERAVDFIKELSNDNELFNELSRNTYLTVKKHFDINIIEHMYHRLIVPGIAED